jgi:hypothetical protein
MVYILRSDGVYLSFFGMTQAQITTMLTDQGLSCTFIDEATYQVAIEAQQGK